MPAGPGSADRLQVSWSAVSSVHSARSVGDLCQCGPGTAAGPRQSLLTSQRRVTRRLCHVRRRVLLQVSDLAAGQSLTSLLVTLGPPEFVNCGIGMGQSLTQRVLMIRIVN